MPQTIQTLFARLNEAAKKLDDQRVSELVQAVGGQLGASKLRLLVVGSSGVGRAAVVNYLLGQPDLLPSSPIPKLPVTILLRYGDPAQVEAVNQIGTRNLVQPGKLRTTLTSPANQLSRLEIATNAELLKSCEVRLESIEADRSLSQWKELIGATDYVILVLKATALLSEQERQFVREVLHPAFGLERVAILLNQIDQVAADERDSIVERVRAFLGSFESQPALIQFSATGAAKGEDYSQLDELVKTDLLENHSALKQAAVRQAAQLCLNEISDAATRQYSLLTTSNDELQQMLDRLNNRDRWLKERIERAQRRTDSFVNMLAREQLLREIEGFSEALRAQLPTELEPIQDTILIKKRLPGYLEYLWAEFFNNRMTVVKQRLTTEMEAVDSLIRDDLNELFGETTPGFQKKLEGFDPTPANLRSFLMPKRGSTPQGIFATALQLGGLVILVGNFPLGLLTIGAGQLIRTIFNRSDTAADKKAILESANRSLQELEAQIKRQVEKQFDELAAQLRQAISQLYEQAVASVKTSLEHALSHRAELEAKKAPLIGLVEHDLPVLRQQLEQLTGQTAAALG